jgi:hypothetical protein
MPVNLHMGVIVIGQRSMDALGISNSTVIRN